MPTTLSCKPLKKVTSHFLNMCFTSGKNASTAACIFDKINEKCTEYGFPWENCVSLSIDNTNSMIGRKNSIASRFQQKMRVVLLVVVPATLHI